MTLRQGYQCERFLKESIAIYQQAAFSVSTIFQNFGYLQFFYELTDYYDLAENKLVLAEDSPNFFKLDSDKRF